MSACAGKRRPDTYSVAALGLVCLGAIHGACATSVETRRCAEPRCLDTIIVEASGRDAPDLRAGLAHSQVDLLQPPAATLATPMQALRGLPGIAFQQTTPGQSIVILRGLKGSEVLHRVDGFRLNNTLFRNAPNQYIALVDALMLSSIEVQRGPAGALHGGDAMGGVIDMLSAEPAFDGATPGSERLRFGFNSADRALHSRAELRRSLEPFSLLVGVTEFSARERRAGDGERLAFTGYRSRAGNARLIWTPGPAHRLSLQFQHLRQPDTSRHDELVPGFGQSRPSSSVFRFSPQQRDFAQLQWRWRADSTAFDQLDLQLGQQRIDDDRISRDFGSPLEDREHNRSTLSGLVLDFSKSAGAHTFAYGIDVYLDQVDSERQRRDLDSGVLSPRPSRFPDGSKTRSRALFVAHYWQLAREWGLSWGLRQTAYRTRIPGPPGLAVSISPTDRSGHFSLRRDLGGQTELHAGLGRGFRSPNVFDLGVFGERPGNRFSLPNPNLGSEAIDSLELGIRQRHASWELDLVAFESRYRGKIVAVDTGATTDGGRLIVQNRNLSRLDLHGLELGFAWHPDPLFDVQASATYTRGIERLNSAATPADRVPPINGRWEARWSPHARHWFNLRVDYAVAQHRLSSRDRSDPRIDPDGTPGWATLGVGWQYAGDTLRLAVELGNLGDRRYREHGSGVDASGRSLGLSLDWTF